MSETTGEDPNREIADMQEAIGLMLNESVHRFVEARNIGCAILDEGHVPTRMVARYKSDGVIYMPLIKRTPNSPPKINADNSMPGVLVLHPLPESEDYSRAFLCESFAEEEDQFAIGCGILWTDENGSLIDKLLPDALVVAEHTISPGLVGLTQKQFDKEQDEIRKMQVVAAMEAAPEVAEKTLDLPKVVRMRQITEALSGLTSDDEVPGELMDGGLYNF